MHLCSRSCPPVCQFVCRSVNRSVSYSSNDDAMNIEEKLVSDFVIKLLTTSPSPISLFLPIFSLDILPLYLSYLWNFTFLVAHLSSVVHFLIYLSLITTFFTASKRSLLISHFYCIVLLFSCDYASLKGSCLSVRPSICWSICPVLFLNDEYGRF